MTRCIHRRTLLSQLLAVPAAPVAAAGLAATIFGAPSNAGARQVNPWAPRHLDDDERAPMVAGFEALRLAVPDFAGDVALFNDHGRLRILEVLLFRDRTADLHQDGVHRLTRLAESMLPRPIRIEVVGHHHADGQGFRSFIISQRRAEAVVAALQSRRIPADRLLATGLGGTFPLADNATPEGRARNRRIELLIRSL